MNKNLNQPGLRRSARNDIGSNGLVRNTRNDIGSGLTRNTLNDVESNALVRNTDHHLESNTIIFRCHPEQRVGIQDNVDIPYLKSSKRLETYTPGLRRSARNDIESGFPSYVCNDMESGFPSYVCNDMESGLIPHTPGLRRSARNDIGGKITFLCHPEQRVGIQVYKKASE